MLHRAVPGATLRRWPIGGSFGTEFCRERPLHRSNARPNYAHARCHGPAMWLIAYLPLHLCCAMPKEIAIVGRPDSHPNRACLPASFGHLQHPVRQPRRYRSSRTYTRRRLDHIFVSLLCTKGD